MIGYSYVSFCNFHTLKKIFKSYNCIIVSHNCFGDPSYRSHCHLFFKDFVYVPNSLPYVKTSLSRFKKYVLSSYDEVNRYENI